MCILRNKMYRIANTLYLIYLHYILLSIYLQHTYVWKFEHKNLFSFPTMLCKNYEKIVKIGIVSLFHKQYKTLFRDHMVRLNIISLYRYKYLRLKTEDLRSSESRDHYHEDGNLQSWTLIICTFSISTGFRTTSEVGGSLYIYKS